MLLMWSHDITSDGREALSTDTVSLKTSAVHAVTQQLVSTSPTDTTDSSDTFIRRLDCNHNLTLNITHIKHHNGSMLVSQYSSLRYLLQVEVRLLHLPQWVLQVAEHELLHLVAVCGPHLLQNEEQMMLSEEQSSALTC